LAFEVPAAAGEGPVLSSPVLLVPGEATRLVRMESRPARRGQAAEASLVDLYPFIPRNHRIVVQNVESGTESMTAILPIRVPAGDKGVPPRVEVLARLIPRSTGEEILLNLQVIQAMASTDGREFLILKIDLPRPAVEAGEYDLEIAAEDFLSGKRGAVRTALVMK
jgi:hypothetical protein